MTPLFHRLLLSLPIAFYAHSDKNTDGHRLRKLPGHTRDDRRSGKASAQPTMERFRGERATAGRCRHSAFDVQQPADVLRIDVTIVGKHALIRSDRIQIRH
jgi:hypothetical protein